MADLYIVTVEDDEDGTFWDDPDGYDSIDAAKAAAMKKAPPKGYSAVVYSCTQMLAFPSQERQDGEG